MFERAWEFTAFSPFGRPTACVDGTAKGPVEGLLGGARMDNKQQNCRIVDRPIYTKCNSWLIPLDMSLRLLEKR